MWFNAGFKNISRVNGFAWNKRSATTLREHLLRKKKVESEQAEKNVFISINFETQLREYVRNESQADPLTSNPPTTFFSQHRVAGHHTLWLIYENQHGFIFWVTLCRHSSERSLLYWKRIRKKAEMEQRDLQRFYRTSKRELNNSKERNCKTGAILCMGILLQNRWQKGKMKRRGR